MTARFATRCCQGRARPLGAPHERTGRPGGRPYHRGPNEFVHKCIVCSGCIAACGCHPAAPEGSLVLTEAPMGVAPPSAHGAGCPLSAGKAGWSCSFRRFARTRFACFPRTGRGWRSIVSWDAAGSISPARAPSKPTGRSTRSMRAAGAQQMTGCRAGRWILQLRP